uniref:Uncharacterized protein n=1 Tax=Coccolithus braarudii TaxID=221442 RepID=A0A7S0PWW4_9EUKA|mmetsp:Transcript_21575/g.46459  ORF Transcript_21575/g.46459 Transcript_21575/m.46459 type:complete len:161 (+) Transcript_21575:262-744(+)
MGESGEGSLEPGVASGDVFWVMYPNPFLKYYYKEHPEKLPDGHRDKPEDVGTAASAGATAAADSPMDAVVRACAPAGLPELRQEAPVFSFFSLESDELCGKPGPHHGKRQQVWKCAIHTVDGMPCGVKRTLVCEKPTKAPAKSKLLEDELGLEVEVKIEK